MTDMSDIISLEREARAQTPQTIGPLGRHTYSLEKMIASQWAIDGFLPTGPTIIAGEPGAGKTTNIVAIAATVAHLTPASWGLTPKYRRRVVYASEQPSQVVGALYALSKINGSRMDDVNNWFEVLDTRRMTIEQMVDFIRQARDEYRIGKVEPLIVIDTASASFELENENANSPIARFMSAVKTNSGESSVWVVTHTPKAAKGARDGAFMSSRGGGAFDGDVYTTSYLFRDADSGRRVLQLGKTRFSPEFFELEFGTWEAEAEATDEIDNSTRVQKYVVGVPRRSSRVERREAASQMKRDDSESKVLKVIRENDKDGTGITVSQIRALAGIKNDEVTKILNGLEEAGAITLSYGPRRSKFFSLTA